MANVFIYSVLVTESGIKKSLNSFEFKKTGNGFLVNKQSTFGGKKTRLKKEQILHVDSMLREGMIDIISYFTWFFEEDSKKAMDLVDNKIRETVTNNAATANLIFNIIKEL